MNRPAEPTARRVLSSIVFWLALAYFVLVLVVVQVYRQNGQILAAQRRADQTETLRLAAIQANASSSYAQCVSAIPTLGKVNRFIHGVQDLAGVLYENGQAAHLAEPAGTTLYRTQTKNLARLKRGVGLVAGISFPVPTGAQCRARRDAILAQAAKRSAKK